jgi:cytochrome c556
MGTNVRGRLAAGLLGGALTASLALAHGAGHELPEGPIRERHDLMEDIGKNSKKIGGAMKAGSLEGVPEAADAIKAAAGRIPSLFPEGSVHEKSRAKPEIWQSWNDFKRFSAELEESAGSLAVAARSGLSVEAASQAMFTNCKSCHDRFRTPEE